MEEPTDDVLQDIESELQMEDASKGQRFINYTIDMLAFYLGLVLLAVFFTLPMEPDALIEMLDTPALRLIQIIIVFLYGLYMSLTEALTKGKSLGKLITGTRAVHENGFYLSWQDAFKRGLVRLIPFETLSALIGVPWHDKWTNTRVIRIKK